MRTAILIALVVETACGSKEQGARLDARSEDVASAADSAHDVDPDTLKDDTSDSQAPDSEPEDSVPDDDTIIGDTIEAEDAGDEIVGIPTIAERCFPGIDPSDLSGPDYDQLAPIIGSHCLGTNQQDIHGIQEVVFFGDSVTVGTPDLAHLLSIDNQHLYRNLLAEWLADRFHLSRGDDLTWGFWKTYDYVTGKGGVKVAGDFRDCAKWGARTDDLLEGGGQLADCFPDGGTADTTLVVFTMGGNDIAAITQEGAEATPEEVAAGYPAERALAASTVQYLDDAVAYLKDPAHFPGGAYVVFANPYEFTDATGRTDSCSPQNKLDIPGIGEIDLSDYDIPVASLAGYGAWADPAQQREIVISVLEGYMRVATQHGVDMVFMLEHFCGHGYVASGEHADPSNACYQGPDAELWFDETCIHPSVAGHRAIAEMFEAVISE